MDLDLIEKIRKLANDGYLEIDIAKKLNIAHGTVKTWSLKYGIKIKSRKDIVIQRKHEIIELYKAGKTINELRALHYSHELIKKTIIESGLEWRGPEKRGEEKRLSDEEVLTRIPNSDEYKIIGFEPSIAIGKRGKYIIQASDGSVFKKESSKLIQGKPKRKKGLENFDKFAERVLERTGMTLLRDGFIDMHKPAKFICPKGHMKRLSVAGNVFNKGCSICNNTGTSKQEIDVLEFIREFCPSATKFFFPKKEKTPGRLKELDIYIPELKLAIEYCGLYNHNEMSRLDKTIVTIPRDKNYHYNKYMEAQKLGIRLITIFEDEWIYRNSQVKGFLKSIIKKADKVYYARKLKVSETDIKEVKEFMDKYHIQGATGTNMIAFKLCNNEGDTIGMITGGKHHRQNSLNDILILDRLCFKDDICVVGGASKLFSALKEYALAHNFTKIVSWSDNRWSVGNVYNKMGFTLEENLRPDYSYYDSKTGDPTRLSKQSNQKKKLIKKGAEGSMKNTERELALTLGLYRIWDCGKKRWVFDLK